MKSLSNLFFCDEIEFGKGMRLSIPLFEAIAANRKVADSRGVQGLVFDTAKTYLKERSLKSTYNKLKKSNKLGGRSYKRWKQYMIYHLSRLELVPTGENNVN